MGEGILREGKLGGLGSEIYSGIYSAPWGLSRFWARGATTSIDVLGIETLLDGCNKFLIIPEGNGFECMRFDGISERIFHN
jgi:hypothetical protein